MKKGVLAIGELLADLITDDFVEDLSQATHLQVFQGGSPANLCANLQWLNTNATLLACVGDDGIGKMIVASLKRCGIDGSNILIDQRYPTSLVLVGRSLTTPDFIAYRLADRQITVVNEALISNAAIVHSSAFALSLEPARSNILDAMLAARKAGASISVDWNFSSKIWGSDNGQEVFARLCSMRPLFKFSMDDAERFWGRTLSIREAKSLLDDIPASVICLTCGKDGVWYKVGIEGIWNHKKASQVHEVKDTTGAGDAFWAGFLSAWTNGLSSEQCIEKGLAIAARKVQIIGPLYAVSI